MTAIISRAAAKARGLKRFFTGEPCNHGHVCERYTSNVHCVECSLEHERTWRMQNPEWYCGRYRRAHAKNPERFRAKFRKWYAKHREEHAPYMREKMRKAHLALRILTELGVEL